MNDDNVIVWFGNCVSCLLEKVALSIPEYVNENESDRHSFNLLNYKEYKINDINFYILKFRGNIKDKKTFLKRSTDFDKDFQLIVRITMNDIEFIPCIFQSEIDVSIVCDQSFKVKCSLSDICDYRIIPMSFGSSDFLTSVVEYFDPKSKVTECLIKGQSEYKYPHFVVTDIVLKLKESMKTYSRHGGEGIRQDVDWEIVAVVGEDEDVIYFSGPVPWYFSREYQKLKERKDRQGDNLVTLVKEKSKFDKLVNEFISIKYNNANELGLFKKSYLLFIALFDDFQQAYLKKIQVFNEMKVIDSSNSLLPEFGNSLALDKIHYDQLIVLEGKYHEERIKQRLNQLNTLTGAKVSEIVLKF